jgi:hypothetical protein
MVITHSRTLQNMFYVKPLEIKCRFIYSDQRLKTCFIQTLVQSYCLHQSTLNLEYSRKVLHIWHQRNTTHPYSFIPIILWYMQYDLSNFMLLNYSLDHLKFSPHAQAKRKCNKLW